jgi:hypothetical protein
MGPQWTLAPFLDTPSSVFVPGLQIHPSRLLSAGFRPQTFGASPSVQALRLSRPAIFLHRSASWSRPSGRSLWHNPLVRRPSVEIIAPGLFSSLLIQSRSSSVAPSSGPKVAPPNICRPRAVAKGGGQGSAELALDPLVSSFHMAVSGASLKAVSGVPSFISQQNTLYSHYKY